MVINNQYYDWGFQSRFSAMAIILSMDIIYSTMEGIVPSRCRLTTRHLGATLFKLTLHQICKSHVTANMHHVTWGLMQSHCLLILLKTRLIISQWAGPWGLSIAHVNNSSLHDHIYKVPAHYCIMTWPLGATLVEVLWASVNYKSQVAASMTIRHLGAT